MILRLLKLIVFVLPFLILNYTSSAQSFYDAGYIITNEGKRIECFIRNEEAVRTQQKLRYKLTKGGKAIFATSNDIQSFQIYGYPKHEKHVVTFTRTANKVDNNWHFAAKTDTLLLAVLVEGNPSLLAYDIGGITNYFYRLPDGEPPVPLQYSKHVDNDLLYRYHPFWDQLLQLAGDCGKIDTNTVRKVKYKASDLVPIFETINSCNKTDYKSFDRNGGKKGRKLIRVELSLTPGINLSNLEFNKYLVFYGDKVDNLQMGNKAGFRLGSEIALYSTVLRGWSAFLEPSYQQYGKADKATDANHGLRINLATIDLAMGIRYRQYIRESFSLFVNAIYVPYGLKINSESIYYDTYTPNTQHTVFKMKMDTNRFIALGLGAQYKRFGFEARYYFSGNVLSEFERILWTADYQRINLMARFKVF